MDENRKSTPIAEFECPRLSTSSLEEHTVTKDSEDGELYTCVCGAHFQWTDQLHWALHPE